MISVHAGRLVYRLAVELGGKALRLWRRAVVQPDQRRAQGFAAGIQGDGRLALAGDGDRSHACRGDASHRQRSADGFEARLPVDLGIQLGLLGRRGAELVLLPADTQATPQAVKQGGFYRGGAGVQTKQCIGQDEISSSMRAAHASAFNGMVQSSRSRICSGQRCRRAAGWG